MMKRLSLVVAAAIANLALLLSLVAVGGYLLLERDLPAVDQLAQSRLAQPLRIYSLDGERIAEFGDQRRVPLDGGALPEHLVQAILAAEDANFFEHPGFDTGGLLRAAWQLLRTGEMRQGGSTITMQVARNFYLSREKSFRRKALEILLAIRIEQNLSKDQILGLYVNKIFLGNRAYGFGAAAELYYGRPTEQLDVAEVALLAGLPKAPSRDNPLVNRQRALERRDYVLGRMHALGYLDADGYRRALAHVDTAGHHGFAPQLEADHVAEMARAWMLERYGDAAYENGYQVITTILGAQQRAANQALRSGLQAYDRRHGFRGPIGHLPAAELDDQVKLQARLRALPTAADLLPAVRVSSGQYVSAAGPINLGDRNTDRFGARWQPSNGDVVYLSQEAEGWRLAQLPQVEGAFVALQPGTGAITALVGGYDFNRSRFNRALQAQRQPGSTFKPFIYAAALATGYTAASIINDAPVAFPAETPDGYWRPENYTGRFYGPTRLREALAQSRNLVSVRLLNAVGVDFTRRYCLRFGFAAERLPPNLSLALGTASVTPLELAAGYAVIANGGFRVNPYMVERVLDSQGQVLWQAPPVVSCEADCAVDPAATDAVTHAPRVLPATDAYILNSMLRDAIDHGTAVRARSLGRADLAGKTGTTNDERDAWFAGFNSHLLATVWVGFDQPQSLGKGETGARAALPIWMNFMSAVLPDIPAGSPPAPAGLVALRIDRHSGQRTADSGPDTLFEWFSADRLPATLATQPPPADTPAPARELNLF